jgi:hypothetical protein
LLLAARRLCIAVVALFALGSASVAQRLLLGTWQAKLDRSTATLIIITADGEGWVHGILRYEPPQQDGFAGSPAYRKRRVLGRSGQRHAVRRPALVPRRALRHVPCAGRYHDADFLRPAAELIAMISARHYV